MRLETCLNWAIAPVRDWVQGVARRALLPAADRYVSPYIVESCEAQFREQFHRNPVLSRNYTVERHEVATPDGARLNAILLRCRGAEAGTPTVIRFNGNGELSWRGSTWMAEEAARRGARTHFVYFDYRGVGASTGQMERMGDLATDGAAVVEWVRDSLETPSAQIHLYGWSLGGAVAIHTKAADPTLTGNLIADRSFESLDAVARHTLGNGLIARVGCLILRGLGHVLEPSAVYPELRGRNWVFYHGLDAIIPPAVSLARAVPEAVALQEEPHYEPTVAATAHHAPVEWFPGAVATVREFLPRVGGSLRRMMAREIS